MMLFEDELVRGNVSLKLFYVRLEDEGSYTCLVVKDGKVNKTVIQLSVGKLDQIEKMLMCLKAVEEFLMSLMVICL